MPQGHLDRLSALDASFLTNESASTHMHVGGILIFEGPPPAYDELAEHVRSRLALVPRFRQKLVVPPLGTGRPLWSDDETFNLSYHVRHSALPTPGTEEQLRLLGGRIFSQQLDRSKPLWELWMVQGLEGDRFALVTKTHHAMVDGVSGVDIATVLFDLTRDVSAPAEPDGWVADHTPSDAEMLVIGASDAISFPGRAIGRIAGAIQHPNRTAHQIAESVEALGEVASAFADPAPTVPLNEEIGPHRSLELVRVELETLKQIKKTLGGTVNDVVLTVVAGALREWLINRRIRTEGLELRAQVPVSIRAEDEHGTLGNKIAVMRGPLPVYVADPAERLAIVSRGMAGIKESKQALGAEVISRFNDFAPPTLLAQASRVNFSTRLFNLIVTNVPGPQFPLYVLGRELLDAFPVAFLPRRHGLAIAIMSYNGGIDFGLIGDMGTMSDMGVVAEGISASVEELAKAASEAEEARGSSTRAR